MTNDSITTPYAAHKLVNAALEKAGLSKRIPPQMMYNYTQQRVNAGKQPLIAFTIEDGVDLDSLATWIEGYIAKQATKENKAAATATATFAEVY